MTIDQAIDRYTNNAEYERIHGSLQGCLEFRQLAEWLKDYKRLLEQEPCIQEKQANADKIDAVYIDGFKAGYSQARFDLEQQPCDDVVSRVAVYEIISDIRDCISVEGYCAIIERLKKLPPVTPQQKYGKWIYDRTRDWDGECKYECSECGMGSDVNYSYCMRCGAKMQESE